MILQLPSEVWDIIADMVVSDLLSQVCRQLWESLGSRRYVRLICNSEQAVKRVKGVSGNLRSLQLMVRDTWNPADTIDVLRAASYLHTMVLVNGPLKMGATGAQALAGLKNASLHTLTLNLFDNAVGDSGAHALAALKDCPRLQILNLDLRANAVGDNGAHALAQLKNSPSLHTLNLDLRANSIGDSGARALADLKDAQSLHALNVDLRANAVVVSGPMQYLRPSRERSGAQWQH